MSKGVRVVSAPRGTCSRNPVFFGHGKVCCCLCAVNNGRGCRCCCNVDGASPVKPCRFPRRSLLAAAGIRANICNPKRNYIFRLRKASSFCFTCLRFNHHDAGHRACIGQVRFGRSNAVGPISIRLGKINMLQRIGASGPLRVGSLRTSSIEGPVPVGPVSSPAYLHARCFSITFTTSNTGNSH